MGEGRDGCWVHLGSTDELLAPVLPGPATQPPPPSPGAQSSISSGCDISVPQHITPAFSWFSAHRPVVKNSVKNSILEF